MRHRNVGVLPADVTAVDLGDAITGTAARRAHAQLKGGQDRATAGGANQLVNAAVTDINLGGILRLLWRPAGEETAGSPVMPAGSLCGAAFLYPSSRFILGDKKKDAVRGAY